MLFYPSDMYDKVFFVYFSKFSQVQVTKYFWHFYRLSLHIKSFVFHASFYAHSYMTMYVCWPSTLPLPPSFSTKTSAHSIIGPYIPSINKINHFVLFQSPNTITFLLFNHFYQMHVIH
jgi:hypothetical protein